MFFSKLTAAVVLAATGEFPSSLHLFPPRPVILVHSPVGSGSDHRRDLIDPQVV